MADKGIRKVKSLKSRKGKSLSRASINKYIHYNYKLSNNLNKITRLPKNNESAHIITQAQFNAFTFIPFIDRKEKIEYIYMSTYSISKKTVGVLLEMLRKEKLQGCYLVISTFITNVKKDIAGFIEQAKKINNNFKYISTHNHSKVILIKTENNYYTIEGSGNLTMNGRIEQYVLTCSKELYDFHEKWMLTV